MLSTAYSLNPSGERTLLVLFKGAKGRRCLWPTILTFTHTTKSHTRMNIPMMMGTMTIPILIHLLPEQSTLTNILTTGLLTRIPMIMTTTTTTITARGRRVAGKTVSGGCDTCRRGSRAVNRRIESDEQFD